MKKKKFVHLTDCDDVEMGTREVIDGKRVYVTPNGNVYPSITSILALQEKPGLDEWKAKVGQEEATKIMKESAALGTKVHDLCERYLYNEKLQCNDKEAISVFNRLRFILGNVNNIFCLEAPLHSDIL